MKLVKVSSMNPVPSRQKLAYYISSSASFSPDAEAAAEGLPGPEMGRPETAALTRF